MVFRCSLPYCRVARPPPFCALALQRVTLLKPLRLGCFSSVVTQLSQSPSQFPPARPTVITSQLPPTHDTADVESLVYSNFSGLVKDR